MDTERLHAIYTRTLADLQAVIRDHEVNEDEINALGRYLNRLGKAGLFPNLLGILFSMTAVEATRKNAHGTRQILAGPFYSSGAPFRQDGVLHDGRIGPTAALLDLSGVVRDAETGEPVKDAELDVWQSDREGVYDHSGFALRGVIRAADDGRYELHTVVPGDYGTHDDDAIGELFRAVGTGGRRAAHVHVTVTAPGYQRLTTQLFSPLSDHLHDDYLESAVSDDLVLRFTEQPARGTTPAFSSIFDFRLDPERSAPSASAG